MYVVAYSGLGEHQVFATFRKDCTDIPILIYCICHACIGLLAHHAVFATIREDCTDKTIFIAFKDKESLIIYIQPIYLAQFK